MGLQFEDTTYGFTSIVYSLHLMLIYFIYLEMTLRISNMPCFLKQRISLTQTFMAILAFLFNITLSVVDANVVRSSGPIPHFAFGIFLLLLIAGLRGHGQNLCNPENCVFFRCWQRKPPADSNSNIDVFEC